VSERQRLDGAQQTVSGADWMHTAIRQVHSIELVRLTRCQCVVVGIANDVTSVACWARSVVGIPSSSPFDAAQDVKIDAINCAGGGRPKGCAPTLSGAQRHRDALMDLGNVESGKCGRHFGVFGPRPADLR
jgi:hypothetical protein